MRLDSTPVRAVSFQTSPLDQQLFRHHDDHLYWNSQQGSGSASSGPTGLTFDISVSFCCSIVVCSFCNCRACLFLSERGRRLSYRLLRNAISSDHSHTIVYSVRISPVLKRYVVCLGAVNFCWMACVRWLHSTVLLVISCNYASLQRGCVSQLLTLLSGVIEALCTQTPTPSLSLKPACSILYIHTHALQSFRFSYELVFHCLTLLSVKMFRNYNGKNV